MSSLECDRDSQKVPAIDLLHFLSTRLRDSYTRCPTGPKKTGIPMMSWLPTMLSVAKLVESRWLSPWVKFCAVACIGVGIGARADAGREAIAGVSRTTACGSHLFTKVAIGPVGGGGDISRPPESPNLGVRHGSYFLRNNVCEI